jgi:hypothetical protein
VYAAPKEYHVRRNVEHDPTCTRRKRRI